jgi:hypothetical protein
VNVEPVSYIDQVAAEVASRSGSSWADLDAQESVLYRIYAALALSTGELTTNRHVHDAWSAWMAGMNPGHRSLIPFDKLSEEVQELDSKYRDAIRSVAKELGYAETP